MIEGVELPDPASRWQPAGLRGPSRVLDTGDVRVDRRRLRARPRSPTASSTSCTSARSRPRGRSTPSIPHLRGAARARRHHDRADAGRRVPGPPRLGLRRRLPVGRPVVLRRPARRSSGSSTPPTPRASPCSSTSSTTTSAPRASQALEAFGPYFTDKYETLWGKAMNYDDEDCDGVREWVLQSAEGWIRDFHLDGLRLDAVHAIFDGGAEHLVAGARAPRARARPARARDRRERPERPEGRALARARRLGLRRASGPTTSTTRCACCSPATATATTRSSATVAAAGQGVPPPARPRRRLLDVPRAGASARRADDVPPERFVVFDQNHDQVGNRALGDRLPAEARPLAALCTLLSPFTPMLFKGEEYGETRAVPVLRRPHRRGDRRRHARGPPARVRRLRRVRRRGGPRPAGPGDVPPLEAHARGRAGGPARPLRAPARARRAIGPGEAAARVRRARRAG